MRKNHAQWLAASLFLASFSSGCLTTKPQSDFTYTHADSQPGREQQVGTFRLRESGQSVFGSGSDVGKTREIP